MQDSHSEVIVLSISICAEITETEPKAMGVSQSWTQDNNLVKVIGNEVEAIRFCPSKNEVNTQTRRCLATDEILKQTKFQVKFSERA